MGSPSSLNAQISDLVGDHTTIVYFGSDDGILSTGGTINFDVPLGKQLKWISRVSATMGIEAPYLVDTDTTQFYNNGSGTIRTWWSIPNVIRYLQSDPDNAQSDLEDIGLVILGNSVAEIANDANFDKYAFLMFMQLLPRSTRVMIVNDGADFTVAGMLTAFQDDAALYALPTAVPILETNAFAPYYVNPTAYPVISASGADPIESATNGLQWSDTIDGTPDPGNEFTVTTWYLTGVNDDVIYPTQGLNNVNSKCLVITAFENTGVVGGDSVSRSTYLTSVLEALLNCVGLVQTNLVQYKIVIQIDDVGTNPATMTNPCVVAVNDFITALNNVPFEATNVDQMVKVVRLPYRCGIYPSKLRALRLGFEYSDFVVHLEDDCAPSRDFLYYMEEMAPMSNMISTAPADTVANPADDPATLPIVRFIGGYNPDTRTDGIYSPQAGVTNDPASDIITAEVAASFRASRWFFPWGVGYWWFSFYPLNIHCAATTNAGLQGSVGSTMTVMTVPTFSRIQNIGNVAGEHWNSTATQGTLIQEDDGSYVCNEAFYARYTALRAYLEDPLDNYFSTAGIDSNSMDTTALALFFDDLRVGGVGTPTYRTSYDYDPTALVAMESVLPNLWGPPIIVPISDDPWTDTTPQLNISVVGGVPQTYGPGGNYIALLSYTTLPTATTVSSTNTEIGSLTFNLNPTYVADMNTATGQAKTADTLELARTAISYMSWPAGALKLTVPLDSGGTTDEYFICSWSLSGQSSADMVTGEGTTITINLSGRAKSGLPQMTVDSIIAGDWRFGIMTIS